MAGDLDGIQVVAIEQAVAAPYATCKLADAGARVIKVERPEGDFARDYDRLAAGHSAYFVWLNRGKQSIRLDLKDPADAALVRRMVAAADVFVQNLIPGAAERLGFGSSDLRAAHPRLITCDISGYGEEGPLRDLKAYDLLIQGESGLANINGTVEEPGRVGVSVCDIAAGMTAFQAILQALFARERTGKGRGIQVSLFHAMADWMNVPYLQARYGGKPPSRSGLQHPSISPYGLFRCGDGLGLLISIQNEREWQRFCAQVLGLPELADDPQFFDNPTRVVHRAELTARIEQVFAGFDRDAVIRRLEEARIAYGRLSSLDDLMRHPQARFVAVELSDGKVIDCLATGVVVAGREDRYGPVPALGADDAALRAEFAEG
ncbi:MAG: CoA transferase [Rhodospirillaceae bacterium]|nr:CoA transferase [Rhodospirillaceae bacterium]